MKTVSLELELRVIRTLTNSKSQKESAKLFSSITEDCFYTKSGRTCYTRIYTLMRERGELVGWGELKVDPVLPEPVREKITSFKEPPIPPDKLDRAVKILHKYRRMRSMLELSQYIVKQLSKKGLDVDLLADETAKKILENRVGQDVTNWFIHVGAKDKSDLKAVRKLMEYDAKKFIPTGIKAFDDRSLGIPRGSLFMLAGPTGSGKSIATGQLIHNMALSGARVCVVPLEMSNEEMLQREISRLTRIEMTALNDPRKLSQMEKENVISRYKRFREKLVRIGAGFSLFSPKEDMTAEEVLFALKPFDFDAVMIDYVGLLKGVDGDDQWRAMRNVTRFSKRFSSMNNMIVGICAQLSDEGLIRYSRGMVEDTSNAFFLRKTAATKETGIMWVDQPKSRNQEEFRFPTIMDYKTMTWRDLDEDERANLDEESEKRKAKGKNKQKTFKKTKTGNKTTFDFDSDD